jgi:hypothetical protein
MKRSCLVLSALALALTAAQPAGAVVTKAVYAGVFSIDDQNDVLGLGAGAYDHYGTLTFIFDSATPGSIPEFTAVPGDYTRTQLYGTGAGSPGRGLLRIGSYSSGFVGTNGSSYARTDGLGGTSFPYDDMSHHAENFTDFGAGNGFSLVSLDGYAGSFNDDFITTADLGAPLSYAPDDPTDIGYGAFTFQNTSPGSPSYANGVFQLQSVTVTQLAGPVPEPMTWELTIGGLAMAGAALRRRRPAGAPARG